MAGAVGGVVAEQEAKEIAGQEAKKGVEQKAKKGAEPEVTDLAANAPKPKPKPEEGLGDEKEKEKEKEPDNKDEAEKKKQEEANEKAQKGYKGNDPTLSTVSAIEEMAEEAGASVRSITSKVIEDKLADGLEKLLTAGNSTKEKPESKMENSKLDMTAKKSDAPTPTPGKEPDLGLDAIQPKMGGKS